ncbi:hypothetical protein MO867_14080 [Microbulbifer sp. OS29]|uniref:Virion structural protein n=1 Tax=Microbulbifer okhotskensis TaxID=2926617 RepID=A0A9X2ETV7_9GAMM|nr:hypothetical protein [Microbulbifer okhotskensis]MCO1335463.1 hypothetical protein [Microbulbifer okhotskensis]
MVELTGFFQGQPQQLATDHLNVVPLDTLGEALHEQRAVAAIPPGKTGSIIRTPLESIRRSLSGAKVSSFTEDFYNQIHITPARLDVGNISNAQTHQVTVWNAYLESHTLKDLSSENADGITIAGQVNPPLVFGALQEREWDLQILTDGPAVISAEITWQFASGDYALLTISGNRVMAWPFAPDWSQGVHEMLEWLTDILPSRTAVEQRRALREFPRRFYSFQTLATGAERTRLDLALYGWGARVWAVPIWHDVQLLTMVAAGSEEITCTTEYRDFVAGGTALLLGENANQYEVLNVRAIQSDRLQLIDPVQNHWPQGTRLYPMRNARLVAQPQMQKRSGATVRAQVEFLLVEPTDWPTDSLPSYRGWPVLEVPAAESNDLSSSYIRLLDALDNDIDNPAISEPIELGLSLQSHRWLTQGAGERAALRSLFYMLRGRQKSVWLPTGMEDLQLLDPIPTNSSSLDIAHVHYVRLVALSEGRRDLRIELRDGTTWYRRITNCAEVDSQTERLALDSPLDRAIDPAEVRRISFMALVRADSDRVELNHITDIEGAASAQILFRGVRDEL